MKRSEMVSNVAAIFLQQVPECQNISYEKAKEYADIILSNIQHRGMKPPGKYDVAISCMHSVREMCNCSSYAEATYEWEPE